MIKKNKKPNRKKIFVDLPVTFDTREQVKKAKKKTGSRTYDELVRKMTASILDEELI